MAVAFPRASIFEGLPNELLDELNELLDERLKPSSLRTVHAAMVHWKVVYLKHHWQEIILSDDQFRGGKLAAFVLYLVGQTELAYETISRYVWGLRTWMKSKGQVDPIFGLYDWADFMTSIHVKTWCVGEPRQAIPLDLLRKVLLATNVAIFWEVQMAVFIVLYLFSFARSEHPCPKTYDGFDKDQHARVDDIQIITWRTVLCVGCRLKVIKQDPRMERPEAAGNEDWVYIGNVDDPQFSIFLWMRRLFQFHGGPRLADSPFFLDENMARVLTYGSALKQFRRLIVRVSDDATSKKYGLHSLRVTGWNGARSGPSGEEVAVAHGGWHGGSQKRYDRFGRDEVLNLPKVILAAGPHVFNDLPASASVNLVSQVSDSANRLGSSSELHSFKSSVGYVFIDEASDVLGPPFGQRCSNFAQGCLILSSFGRHDGLCGHILMQGKRRR